MGTRKKKETINDFVGLVNEKINIIEIYLIKKIINFNYYRNKEENICLKCKRNQIEIGKKICSVNYDIYLKTHNLINTIISLHRTILYPFNINKLKNKIIYNNKKIHNICDELSNMKITIDANYN